MEVDPDLPADAGERTVLKLLVRGLSDGRAPAKMTFVTSLTDGSYGYLPTADAYDEEAYETDSSIFASDAAQSLIEALCPLPD